MKALLPILLFLFVALTPIVDARSEFRTLKIINNNVHLFEGSKKIDTLTTRGNSRTYWTICKKYSVKNPCVMYKVINKSNFSLVIKHWWLPDTDSGWVTVFIFDQLGQAPQLIDITSKLFWTDAFQTANFNLKNGEIVASVSVNSEMWPNPYDLEKLWFELWNNSGSEEYPVYRKASKTFADSFFLRIIKYMK